MRWWQIRAALRGYYRHQRPLYESAQWHVNAILSSFSKTPHNFPGWGQPWPWSKKSVNVSYDEIKESLELLKKEQEKDNGFS